MTPIEGLFWVGMVAPFVVGVILFAIGVGLSEDGNKSAAKIFFAVGATGLGIAFLSCLKWVILILDKIF